MHYALDAFAHDIERRIINWNNNRELGFFAYLDQSLPDL